MQKLGEGKAITKITQENKGPEEDDNNNVLNSSIFVFTIIFIVIVLWNARKRE
ncbi:hypothetical protein HZA99_06830 [Candidatus Woesearchaeota archaeon]|nr:hypothetical protein [Candidatus Woesearchaeota archaeon]